MPTTKPPGPTLVHTDPDDAPATRARPPRILVVAMGEADATVQAAHGDYGDWFERILAPLGVEVEEVAPFDGEAMPYGGHYDGILLTGSPKSVRDEEPWMPAVGRWAVAMAAHTPVLGVCFGHQLLGEVLGGRVDQNPDGPEWGTVDVPLTPEGRADPLFDGLPDTLRVQQLHRDVVLQEPEPHRFVRLAGNAHTPLQAFAMGPWLRTVQFHPELDKPTLETIFTSRQWQPTAPVEPSDHGRRILENWVRHYVLRVG